MFRPSVDSLPFILFAGQETSCQLDLSGRTVRLFEKDAFGLPIVCVALCRWTREFICFVVGLLIDPECELRCEIWKSPNPEIPCSLLRDWSVLPNFDGRFLFNEWPAMVAAGERLEYANRIIAARKHIFLLKGIHNRVFPFLGAHCFLFSLVNGGSCYLGEKNNGDRFVDWSHCVKKEVLYQLTLLRSRFSKTTETVLTNRFNMVNNIWNKKKTLSSFGSSFVTGRRDSVMKLSSTADVLSELKYQNRFCIIVTLLEAL